MARTPLLRRFQDLFNEFDEADRSGRSVESVREERRQLRFTRRDFLKAAGATVGAVAVSSGIPVFARAGSAPRIGIMGAGIAGLNAALTLQDKGLASTVFEASDRIGGRMHSLMSGYWSNSQTSEWCGELIDSNHKTIKSLAQRFNLPLVDLIAAQPAGSEDTYYVHGHYYTWEQAVNDFGAITQTLKDQLHAAPFPTLYNSFTSFGQYLDNLSGYDWIEKYVPGGHASDFGELLDSAYNQEYGLDMTEQSSLNILYLLAYQPTKQAAGGFAWYGVSDERYHILGGNQQLPQAIASYIQSATPQCTVLTQWRMTAIAVNKDGSITCSFSTPSGSAQQTFDEVILTMPFGVLRGLDYSGAKFDPLKKTAITQLGYGTNTKMNLQFNSRFWNSTGAWPGVSDGNIYTDLPFENAWDATRGQAGSTGIVVLFTGGSIGAQVKLPQPYLTTGQSQTALHYVQQYLANLETVWPGATAHWNGEATVSTPWSDPNLLGSYACWTTGQYTGFSGYERARQGNIHFAGEHCSINFQGFMEGGAEEGERAADEIIGDHL
ncbi:MAG TPA: NAD(P)/FAD-dependent oxidoreductase [Candidatus Baltobacterales bacterium]|nr:NAD(P)/FAD-dependent oxidoreductase [Candidatus Baltobacterales bacterium]